MKLRKIPDFRNEAEERKFWASHDSTEYVDWDKAEEVIFPNLKPSTTKISLRLPDHLLRGIKRLKLKEWGSMLLVVSRILGK
ncbi:MAG: hypothetical protein BWY29_00792 [Microgenomates group bacterium ADurb.Bin238]|jgi:hypothetical protein|nr:MAG: hypothetical protein BWY29_00792 [Microgenomates group bacterium ADurb.Bin238]